MMPDSTDPERIEGTTTFGPLTLNWSASVNGYGDLVKKSLDIDRWRLTNPGATDEEIKRAYEAVEAALKMAGTSVEEIIAENRKV